jgi:hypothetical protein
MNWRAGPKCSWKFKKMIYHYYCVVRPGDAVSVVLRESIEKQPTNSTSHIQHERGRPIRSQCPVLHQGFGDLPRQYLVRCQVLAQRARLRLSAVHGQDDAPRGAHLDRAILRLCHGRPGRPVLDLAERRQIATDPTTIGTQESYG